MKKQIILMLAVLMISCKGDTERIINLSVFVQYNISQRQTEIKLLKSFVIDKSCNINSAVSFSDAFLVSVKNTSDTILIFSICRETYSFLKDDYKGARWLVIDSVKIDKSFPENVTTVIEKSFNPSRFKILVCEINNLQD